MPSKSSLAWPSEVAKNTIAAVPLTACPSPEGGSVTHPEPDADVALSSADTTQHQPYENTVERLGARVRTIHLVHGQHLEQQLAFTSTGTVKRL